MNALSASEGPENCRSPAQNRNERRMLAHARIGRAVALSQSAAETENNLFWVLYLRPGPQEGLTGSKSRAFGRGMRRNVQLFNGLGESHGWFELDPLAA